MLNFSKEGRAEVTDEASGFFIGSVLSHFGDVQIGKSVDDTLRKTLSGYQGSLKRLTDEIPQKAIPE